MHFLAEYGMFLLKAATIVIAILIVIAGIVAISSKGKSGGKSKGKITVKKLNQKFANMAEVINEKTLGKAEQKALKKDKKKSEKAAKKDKDASKPRVFVLDFHGDIKASAVDQLRQEVTAIVLAAKPDDQVLVRLESGGGMVHGYGLASSQLKRLRDAKIKLTVAIDKVAASGGYMMACVADHIIAAPFAIIGSIGVVMQIPNFNRLLKKNDIDFEQLTAGEYKRTLTFFGENTDKARTKVQQEVDEIHELFKSFVTENRSQINIAEVATGEHWFASQAMQRQLVDALQTSDDFILNAKNDHDIYLVKYYTKPSLSKRLSASTQALLYKIFDIKMV